MNKLYTRINWENYPSENTALNESNLNRMDSALNEIDTRVVEHDTTKANVASLNELINYWHIDETTGVITIHKVSGEQIIFDLNIEKVPVGFSMTDDGILIMTTDDGTEFTANIGSMIPILTFQDTDEIAVSVIGEGVNKTYSFAIKTGSIREDKLQPNFLADCRLYAGNAENSAVRAEEYAEQAKESAESISNDAKNISFDDTKSKLGADNTQDAIDTINSNLSELKNSTYGTLLWTNPNATTEFAAQTLDVDVSAYEYFVVEWLQGAGGGGRRCQTIVYPTTTDLSAANMQQVYATAQYIQFNSRGCYVSNGKVAFSQGSAAKISSAGAFTAPATANNIAVPYRIIGYNKIIE